MTQTIPSTANQYGRYEKVPPEGGWGYVVTLAVSLVFVSIYQVLYFKY